MNSHKNSRFMKIYIKIPNLWNFHNIIKFVKKYQIHKKFMKVPKNIKNMKIYQKKKSKNAHFEILEKGSKEPDFFYFLIF